MFARHRRTHKQIHLLLAGASSHNSMMIEMQVKSDPKFKGKWQLVVTVESVSFPSFQLGQVAINWRAEKASQNFGGVNQVRQTSCVQAATAGSRTQCKTVRKSCRTETPKSLGAKLILWSSDKWDTGRDEAPKAVPKVVRASLAQLLPHSFIHPPPPCFSCHSYSGTFSAK